MRAGTKKGIRRAERHKAKRNVFRAKRKMGPGTSHGETGARCLQEVAKAKPKSKRLRALATKIKENPSLLVPTRADALTESLATAAFLVSETRGVPCSS